MTEQPSDRAEGERPEHWAVRPDAGLIFELRGGVGILTLDRPEAKNALDIPTRRGLADLVLKVRDAPEVRALVITGAGGIFCSGGDLKSLSESRTSEENRKRIQDLHVWLPQLVGLEKPVVAAVDGPAFGGGFNLALTADFILATPRARFCQVFARIGMVPDLAGLYLLPRMIGLQAAKDIVLSGRIVGAEEAKGLRIVHRVVEPGNLLASAVKLAERLSRASPLAYGLAKNILGQSFNLDQRALAEMEAYAQALCIDSAYHKEAIRRFLNKEAPLFDWDTIEKTEGPI